MCPDGIQFRRPSPQPGWSSLAKETGWGGAQGWRGREKRWPSLFLLTPARATSTTFFSPLSSMPSSAAVSGPISAPQAVQAVPLPSSNSPDVAAKYRGAVVEDMQPGPAVCVFRDATVDRALVVAHDHDYSQLPLVSKERKLLGYVDVASLQERLQKGLSQPSDRVDTAMVKFRSKPGGASHYHIITPQTDLADLEGMLSSIFYLSLFVSVSSFGTGAERGGRGGDWVAAKY